MGNPRVDFKSAGRRARHGVMGAQIAAHLVNVKVPVVLFDLPAKGP
jgi:hypothetical protein